MPVTGDYQPTDRNTLIDATMDLAGRIYDDLPPEQQRTFALRLAGFLASVFPSSHDAELDAALRGEWIRLA